MNVVAVGLFFRDRRRETGDKRKETRDEARDRQETRDKRKETRERRQDRRDKRQETRNKRQETRSKRQGKIEETRDKRLGTRDTRQATKYQRQETRDETRDQRQESQRWAFISQTPELDFLSVKYSWMSVQKRTHVPRPRASCRPGLPHGRRRTGHVLIGRRELSISHPEYMLKRDAAGPRPRTSQNLRPTNRLQTAYKPLTNRPTDRPTDRCKKWDFCIDRAIFKRSIHLRTL